MNLLCHARNHLDRPWIMAGTVLPDLTRMTGVRVRPHMIPAAGDGLAEGLRRHFEDDAWFHATPAFAATMAVVTARIRERHPDRPGRRMRASFYAHLMVEMLLDAWLMERRPGTGAAFRAAIDALGAERIAEAASALLPVDREALLRVLTHVRRPAFLSGYADDEEVARRLSAIGQRIRQPALPGGFEEIVALARPTVRERGEALLTRPA